MVVVLPAPFGPRKATISPGWTIRSMPRTACTLPKLLVSPASSMAGTVAGAGPGRSCPVKLSVCVMPTMMSANASQPFTQPS